MADIETDPNVVEDGAAIEAATDGDRPAWLPERFHSPEDLAKAYAHAHTKIGQQGTELHSLRQELAEMQALVESMQAPEYELPGDEQYGWDDQGQTAQYMNRAEIEQRLAMLAHTGSEAMAARLGLENELPGQQPQHQTEAILSRTADLIKIMMPRATDEAYGRITSAIDSQPEVAAAFHTSLDPGEKAVIFGAVAEQVRQQDAEAANRAQSEEKRRLADLAPANASRIERETDDQARWRAIVDAGRTSPWTGGASSR